MSIKRLENGDVEMTVKFPADLVRYVIQVSQARTGLWL